MESFYNLEANLNTSSDKRALNFTNISIYYQEIFSENTKTRWYLCNFPDCSKSFKYKSEIKRHNATHFDHRPHFCTFQGCNKSFKRFDALEVHLHNHNQSLTFACNISGCNFKSISRSELSKHTRQHVNADFYFCKTPKSQESLLISFKNHENRNENKELGEPTKRVKKDFLVSSNEKITKTFSQPLQETRLTSFFNSDVCSKYLLNRLEEVLNENRILKIVLERKLQLIKMKGH